MCIDSIADCSKIDGDCAFVTTMPCEPVCDMSRFVRTLLCVSREYLGLSCAKNRGQKYQSVRSSQESDRLVRTGV